MWLPPSEHLWSRVAVKMVMEACRGVVIMPVVKEASCWWLVGKVAVDCVEITGGHPLFVISHGKIKNCTIPYPVSFFDSFDHVPVHKPGPSQPAIRPEGDCNGWSELQVDSPFHGLPDIQLQAASEPASELVSAPSSQYVLSDVGLSHQLGVLAADDKQKIPFNPYLRLMNCTGLIPRVCRTQPVTSCWRMTILKTTLSLMSICLTVILNMVFR